MILGIDAGNYYAKTIGFHGYDCYRTSICDWFDRFIEESICEDDMEFKIDGRKGFAGKIAEHEDEFGVPSMYGDSKVHEDTKIRVLLAIYRYKKKYQLQDKHFSIVVGQPIANHKNDEKEELKNMLIGSHSVTVNKDEMNIVIEQVEVASEGGSAYWTVLDKTPIRIIDVGSGTINIVSLSNGRIVNHSTNTLNFGVETTRNKSGIVRGIIRNATMLKWNKSDKVYLCGGSAEDLFPFLQEHFKNMQLIIPEINGETLHSIYANAVGFYEIAERVYDQNG